MSKQNPHVESTRFHHHPKSSLLRQGSGAGGAELGYRGRSAAVVVPLQDCGEDAVADLLMALARLSHVSDILLLVDAEFEVLSGSILDELHSFHQRVRVVQSHSPRLAALDAAVTDADLQLPARGWARALWYGLGYLQESSTAQVVAVCSSSLAIQSDAMVALLHPLLSPYGGFQISKACRSRAVNDDPEAALFAPFLDALAGVFGADDHVQRIGRFLSPHSDGLAFRRSLLGGLRLPLVDDLQFALLADLQRSLTLHDLCRVDFTAVGPATAPGNYGELAAVLWENLRSEGTVLSAASLQTVKLSFHRMALDCLTARRSDCAIGGLNFNEHEAELLIEHFAESVFTAGSELVEDSAALATLPSWKRINHAAPDLLARLSMAIDEDFEELSESTLLMPPPSDQHKHYARP